MKALGIRLNRPGLAFAHDLAMTAFGFVLAFLLRVGGATWTIYWDALALGLPLIVLFGALSYLYFDLYCGIWRYASTSDLFQLTKAVTVTTLAFVIAMFFLTRLESVPRSIPIIYWFASITLLGGPRFMYRMMKDRRIDPLRFRLKDDRIPVLLIGTDVRAELFIRSLAADPHAAYKVVGVVDDAARRVGRNIHGIKILGSIDDLRHIVERLGKQGQRPRRLVLSKMPRDIEPALMGRILDEAQHLGLQPCRLPSLTDFKDANGAGGMELRPIAIDDLLGRPPTVLDPGALKDLIAGRRVLVTGAGGSIGSELCRQIAAQAPGLLILLDSSEYNLYSIDLAIAEEEPSVARMPILCDVRNRQRISSIFQQYRPELVFHAAALKHVPLVENNPAEGVLTNCIGTRNVADAALAVGSVAMVLISTDKAVRPANVMGATKRIAESYVQALDVNAPRLVGDSGSRPTRFMTVRFGNVLGSSGSVVPLFRRQLAHGGPLTVTHPNMERYFMTIGEAVELVLHASAYGAREGRERGKIFVLDMGKPVKIVDLAVQMIRLSGLRPDIDIKIEYTGLRPGEKLYEELLYEHETPLPSELAGVLIASPHIIDFALLDRIMNELANAALQEDMDKVLGILSNLVPDYSRDEAQTASQAGTRPPAERCNEPAK